MTTKILIAKPSKNPLWQTMLAEDGPMTPGMPIGDQLVDLWPSYELRVEIFTISIVPEKIIVVDNNHYKAIFEKYSMEDLKIGVKINSLFDVMAPMELDADVVLDEEVSNMVQKIIDELPSLIEGIDSKKYPSTDLKDFLEQQILSLKDKFKIQPK